MSFSLSASALLYTDFMSDKAASGYLLSASAGNSFSLHCCFYCSDALSGTGHSSGC